MTFIHWDRAVMPMVVKAWAQTRVGIPPKRIDGSILPDVVGDGRASLRIHRDRPSIAGPHGALSFPATWRAGRSTGEAIVTIFPFWSWGYELDLAVASPRSLTGRVGWPAPKLERLARSMACSMRASLEETTTRSLLERPSAVAGENGRDRWSVLSATGGSPGR